jgi:hypothetical protein
MRLVNYNTRKSFALLNIEELVGKLACFIDFVFLIILNMILLKKKLMFFLKHEIPNLNK